MKTLFITLVLAYVAVATLAYFASDRLIFLPPASSYARGELPIILVPTRDGARIAALHLPNDTAAYTVLYSHGNAEDVGHLVDLFEAMRDEVGVSVIGYDYRGYGLSTGGPPTTHATADDAEAVYAWATQELGIDPRRLILHGRSVGSGPAIELARHHPEIAGLIIESGFTSAFRVMTRVPILPFDRFPNLRHLRHVRTPVLVIHGVRDEVIPFAHGERLYAEAPDPKRAYWVDAAGHNDLVHTAGGGYWQALQGFVEMVERTPRR